MPRSFPWRKKQDSLPAQAREFWAREPQALILSEGEIKAIEDILAQPVTEPNPAIVEAVRAYRELTGKKGSFF